MALREILDEWDSKWLRPFRHRNKTVDTPLFRAEILLCYILVLDQKSLLPRARPRAHLGPTQPIIGKFFYCAASAGMQK